MRECLENASPGTESESERESVRKRERVRCYHQKVCVYVDACERESNVPLLQLLPLPLQPSRATRTHTSIRARSRAHTYKRTRARTHIHKHARMHTHARILYAGQKSGDNETVASLTSGSDT